VLLSTGLMARGRMGEPDVLAGIGAAAEQAGLHRVWFGDHVVYPVDFAPNYPYGDGRLPYNPASPQLDVVVAMTWLLAATTRVGAGTFVMVIGMRQPVWLAKQLASLDRLSDGRVALGVGTGWMPEEYSALGVSPARRGARTDDCIQVLRKLWTEPTPAHDSEFVSFPPLHCNPKPVRDGGVPIWVGGHGDAALTRVVRHGDGWLPAGGDPEELAGALPRLRELAERHGRDPASIGIATTVTALDPAEIRDRLPRLRDLGVTEAVIPAQGKTSEAVADWIAGIPGLMEG
jgi:probable F420-dependent oxidoreductase